jgi:hypothetical protein
MSALLLKADIDRRRREVCFGPLSDIPARPRRDVCVDPDSGAPFNYLAVPSSLSGTVLVQVSSTAAIWQRLVDGLIWPHGRLS